VRILLVDNRALSHGLVVDMFPGHHVEWANTGTDGVDRALLNPYDVVLVDHSLPDGEGADYVAEMRALGVRVPMVGMVSAGKESAAEAFLEAGADDVCHTDQFATGEVEALLLTLVVAP